MLPRPYRRGRSALLLSALILLAGCASAPKAPTAAPGDRPIPPPVAATPTPGDREEAGIEVVWIRRTAHGHMLDFRYRVTDPENAKELLKRRTAAYLVHEPSGARLGVPTMPKVGSLRQSTMEPEKGRVYFMIFNANGLRVAQGDKVTVVFGKYRFDNLTVQ
jgi:hypothetical protein